MINRKKTEIGGLQMLLLDQVGISSNTMVKIKKDVQVENW